MWKNININQCQTKIDKNSKKVVNNCEKHEKYEEYEQKCPLNFTNSKNI